MQHMLRHIENITGIAVFRVFHEPGVLVKKYNFNNNNKYI